MGSQGAETKVDHENARIHEGAHYRIPPQVYLREVDGQMVLLNLNSEEYYGLDEVGANFVQKLIAMSPDDALSLLVSEYDGASRETLHRDMEALTASLLEADLLQRLETDADGAPG